MGATALGAAYTPCWFAVGPARCGIGGLAVEREKAGGEAKREKDTRAALGQATDR